MRPLLTIVLLTSLSGCATSMSDHLGPPPGVTGEAAVPVDPETVKVDSQLFPKFRVPQAATPPRWTSPRDKNRKSRYPMVDILPSDEWLVRHKVGNSFLIVSKTYDERQCKSLIPAGPGSGCFKSRLGDRYYSDYLYGILISPEGRIAGGWILLKNPERVVLSSERRTHLAPSPWGNEGWGGIVFVEGK